MILVTHHRPQTGFTREFTEESYFQFSAIVIVNGVCLQYFVESFEKEGPKSVDRPICADLIKDVSNVMEIRFDFIRVHLKGKYVSKEIV